MKKLLTCAALLLVFALPVRAGGPAAPPTFIVRVRSLDTLVENVKLLVTLAGQPEIANQVEGLIKAKIGVKGLEGIDTTRPIGAYGRFGDKIDEISGAVLVPIADEKAFLGLLDNLNLQATKGNDGIYTVQTGSPVDVYFRFANRYAYISALNPAALEQTKLADPAKVLGKEGPTFSATLRIDQLPEAARQIATAQIEQNLQDQLDQKLPNETDAQRALRQAAGKEVIKTLVGIINEGAELNLSINLDAAAKELTANLSFAGKPGSELATAIKSLGQRPSQFGGLRSSDAAFQGALHLVLPEPMKQSFAKMLDEAVQRDINQIQDPAKRQQAQKLVEALAPTLKSGEVDGFVQVLGPSAERKFTLLVGAKLIGGAKLGATIEDLLADLLKGAPAEVRDKFQLNVASVGNVKIHRLEVPEKEGRGPKLAELTGDANLYVAFRDDALLLAAGKNGLETLKTAVAAKGTGASPLFLFDVDIARLAALAPTEELRNSAKTLFPGGKEGQVRVVVDGGTTLRLSLTTRLAVLQFLSQTREARVP
jgi:hypothetical protein